MVHENDRESIDYVALHAQRRPKKKGSKNKAARGAGDASFSAGRRVCEPGQPHIRRPKPDGEFLSGPHDAEERPWDEESKEDEDVSSFLDSFSASEATKKTTTSASDGQERGAEAVVFDHAQATLAMSEPLAQVRKKKAQSENDDVSNMSYARINLVCGTSYLSRCLSR